MNLTDILSTSAASSVLLLVAIFLLKNWYLSRLRNSIEYEYRVKQEKLTDELRRKTDIEISRVNAKLTREIELQRMKLGPYSESQFERYNRIWVNLNTLRHSMNKLWDEASGKNYQEFSQLLDSTSLELEESALLFEEKHYNSLINILNKFWDLQLGKKNLIDYRKLNSSPNPEEISAIIEGNRKYREDLLSQTQQVMAVMRRQLNGLVAYDELNMDK